eukprot:CAMPEP_0181135232 /NCGR_PEP_ID=MMETSP1071-20121207/32512_1 /TAXON_ID=35127 /ORGANISM="Thalassiosira sp., Strain NH16" /LENGTH=426 /DNA_ID=CAMNT_0023221805 /DNA_START=44 /DNA_END=1324 /DNA_ORIENTATION=-
MGVQTCLLLTLLPLAATPLARAQLDITSALAANADETTNPISALMQKTSTARQNDNGESSSVTTAPAYDPSQCDGWIDALPASDVDSSGGLSGPEFHSFLSGITNPSYVGAYFREFPSYDKLPWTFRVIHKTLACHCEQMGMGPGCCEGDRAEVHVPETSIKRVPKKEKEYKDLFCQYFAYSLARSVPVPQPTTSPTVGPTMGATTGAPSSSPTAAPTAGPTASPTAGPTISPTAGPSPLPPLSLGPTPTPSDSKEVAAAAEGTPPQVKSLAGPEPEDDGGGMPIGAIIGIIAAVLVAIIALVAYRRKAERDRVRKFAGVPAPEADLETPPPVTASAVSPRPEPSEEPGPGEGAHEDDESSAPSVWSDGDRADEANADLYDAPGEDRATTAGSALAAMGAASTVTKNLMNSGTNNGSGMDASSGLV